MGCVQENNAVVLRFHFCRILLQCRIDLAIAVVSVKKNWPLLLLECIVKVVEVPFLICMEVVVSLCLVELHREG